MSSLKNLRLEDGEKPSSTKPKKSTKKSSTTASKKQKAASPQLDDIDEQQQQLPQEPPDVMSVGKSIVKLFVSSSSVDHGMPYQLQRSQPSTSSGFFITYNKQHFIITNAHCVQNFTTVQVKKYGSSRKYSAQVLYIADTCDLAVLTVTEPGFWKNAPSLRIGGVPQVNSTVQVVGFPTGGDELSVTQGVVSRVGMQTYAHSADSYCAIQIDAAINSGNSGGAVVGLDPETNEFVVVGVAFEAMMGANSIGYMISTTVLNRMLEAFRTNNNGCPSLNIVSQSIESIAQRKSLFIPPLAGLIDYLYDMKQFSSTLMSLLEAQGLAVQYTDENGNPLSKEEVDAITAAQKDKKEDGEAGDEEFEDDLEPMHFIVGQDDEYDYVVFNVREGDEEDDDEEQGENDEDDEEEDEDNENVPEKDNELIETLPKPTKTKKEKLPSPISPNEDGTHDATLVLGDAETPVYRIKRTTNERGAPPLDLLPLLLSENALYETQIGIAIRNIIPFTKSSELLQVGDVILAIDNIPISTDETILFRENERIRYNFLTSNKQIGDTCSVLVLRGFDILTIEVPIQQKAVVAKLFNYSVPEWFVALGLSFVPLSGNLMENEFGDEWTTGSPVTLLRTLFLGALERFHPDQEIIILNQIFAHHITEGYDQQMEVLTHVNGERVINMKHLSELISSAVIEYENQKKTVESIQQTKKIATSPSAKSPTGVSPIVQSPTEEEEVLDPKVFFQMFSEQLTKLSKLNNIVFTLESGQIITLSLVDGHKHQIEILKIHQIPFPGAASSLTPMYNMKLDYEFTNPELPKDAFTPSLPPVKAAQKAQILSPTPLSPRNSFETIPYTRQPSGTKDRSAILNALEIQPSLSQSHFTNDFGTRSPQELAIKHKKKSTIKK